MQRAPMCDIRQACGAVGDSAQTTPQNDRMDDE